MRHYHCVICLVFIIFTSQFILVTHAFDYYSKLLEHVMVRNESDVIQINTNISNYFQNCSGYNNYLKTKLYVNGPDEHYISKISCERVYLFKEYSILPLFNSSLVNNSRTVSTAIYETSETYELCETVNSWEKKLNLTSNDLVNQYTKLLNSFYLNDANKWVQRENISIVNIYKMTSGETTVFDWFNYWTYCVNANAQIPIISSNDTLPGYMTSKSVLYCGSLEFGIPLLNNKGEYICHCDADKNGYFAMKCNGNLVIYRIALGLWYASLSIISLGLLATFFIVFLPKLVTAIRTKNFIPLHVTIVNMLAILIILANVISICVTSYQLFNRTFDATMLILCGSALVFWILKYLRLIVYIKNRSYPRYLRRIYVFLYLFTVVLTALIVTLIALKYSLIPIYITLATFLILSFSITSLIVYIAMRRMTDVNIIKTTVS